MVVHYIEYEGKKQEDKGMRYVTLKMRMKQLFCKHNYEIQGEGKWEGGSTFLLMECKKCRHMQGL